MADHTDTTPCNSIFEFIGSQARQLNGLTLQLNLSQQSATMYQQSKEFYYELLGKKDEQINNLITMVGNLTDKTIAQREEIVRLKKQRYYNECPDEGNDTDRPE